MRVKEAVLTFVAMGGFAVPVLFQSPASENATADAQSIEAAASAAPDNKAPDAKHPAKKA